MDNVNTYKVNKEAVKKIAEKVYDNGSTVINRNDLEELFPELQESGDERMIKFIKQQLFNIKKTITENYELDAKLTKAIACLEKQGNLMKALQISNAEIGELIEKNYYLKEQLEKQGEQKPTKEHDVCEFCEDRYGCVTPCSMKLIEEEKPTDKIESRQEELTEFEKAVKQVMEEAIECGDTHNLKADADMLLRLVQKSSWSEKDNKMSRFIGNAITVDDASIYLESKGIQVIDAHVWLNGLKDRVQPQKQEWKQENTGDLTDFENAMMCVGESFFGQYAGLDPNDINAIKGQANLLLELVPSKEWSKEDNRMCKAIIDNIQAICEEGYFVGNIDSDELIKWLKSLKDRYVWKPSDEQIEALADALSLAKNCGEENAFDLRTLYEQLKKLRKE